LGIEEHERTYSISCEGGKMNPIDLKKIPYLIFILIFGFLGTRCATPQKELKTYPLSEINLEKVFHENRGLKILEENATMIHDYYRGGVQEKADGKRHATILKNQIGSCGSSLNTFPKMSLLAMSMVTRL
jgi:hypothetical protein